MKPQTPRGIAYQKLEELRTAGFSDTQILDDILYNQLSGSVALEVMTSISDEYLERFEDDDDDDIIDLDESLTHPE
tara:strand:+ start:1387 stop:1614 length:228 start_codon:yes stop_codon:yes gene_type:complete